MHQRASQQNYTNIWRTDHQKYAVYQGDGMGRDTYIKHFNGSFYEPFSNADTHAMPVTGV